jgi:hypothetical protein
VHEFAKKIGGSAGVARNVYEEWEGTPEYQRVKADEARRLIAEYEALTVSTKPGSWCDRVLAYLRRASGVLGTLNDQGEAA